MDAIGWLIIIFSVLSISDSLFVAIMFCIGLALVLGGIQC